MLFFMVFIKNNSSIGLILAIATNLNALRAGNYFLKRASPRLNTGA